MKKTIALALVLLFLISPVAALADHGAIVRKGAKAYANPNMRVPVGTIPKYAAVVVNSVSGGKARVTFRGYAVYVKSKDLMQPWKAFLNDRKKRGIDHTEDCLRYVKKTCYVYDCPSRSGRKLMKVRKGTVLTGFMEKGGWSIVMDGSDTYYGYVKTSNLTGMSGGDGSTFPLDR